MTREDNALNEVEDSPKEGDANRLRPFVTEGTVPVKSMLASTRSTASRRDPAVERG